MTKVLLVEPDKQLANIYSQALTQAGHKVTQCTNAQSAIHAADQIRPDVIILELQLSKHSGIEFLYELRSYPDWQKVPVVINTNVPISEFKDSRNILESNMGVTDYLYKPRTRLSDLLSCVSKSRDKI